MLITVTFLLVCMGMTSLSAVVSVFTLRMHYGMFVNAPPGWLNRVTACTFGHNAAGVKNNISHTHSVSTEENVSLETISTVSSPRVRMDSATSATTEQSLHIAIDKLLAGVEKWRKPVDSREPEDHVTAAWRHSARGLDMLCFWIFLIILLVLAIGTVCIGLLHFEE